MITQTVTQTVYMMPMMSDGQHNGIDMLVYIIGLGFALFLFSYNFWHAARG